MKVIDKRNEKPEETDFEAGDIVEFWDDAYEEKEHGIAILFEDRGYSEGTKLLYYLILTDSYSTFAEGGKDTFRILLENRDHVRKVNAKLVLED